MRNTWNPRTGRTPEYAIWYDELIDVLVRALEGRTLARWTSFNPLFRRAGSIEVPLGPPRRAGVGHWDGAVRCVSVDPVLCGCVTQMGGVQYAPRWL
eukprot:scaffold33637_cov32-Phaeocystis_antarctica.AAC.1